MKSSKTEKKYYGKSILSKISDIANKNDIIKDQWEIIRKYLRLKRHTFLWTGLEEVFDCYIKNVVEKDS